MIEKRHNPRINTTNTVGYAIYDVKKNRIGDGKGRTLNLSQAGTLLQAETKLEGAYVILMAIDLDSKQINVSGKIITSRICKTTGNYLTGIDFVGPKEKQLEAIVAFVKVDQRRKHLALESRRDS